MKFRFRLSVLYSLLCATLTFSFAGELPDRRIELILDASGSMNAGLASGQIRLDAAREAALRLLDTLPDHTVMAVRTYGDQSPREDHNCKDTRMLTGFQPVSDIRSRCRTELDRIRARGYTPIAWVIQQAAADFPDDDADAVLILVSDGKETCDADPCAVARALKQANARLLIHTVGFGVDEATEDQLSCIADATGGSYFAADDVEALSSVLNEAVQTAASEPVEETGAGWLRMENADVNGHDIIDSETGKVVARVSNVKKIQELPAGIYTVVIGGMHWKSVRVRDGETTVLKPGVISMKHALSKGHPVLLAETGVEQCRISNTQKWRIVVPGTYDVMFGAADWRIRVGEGETVSLEPAVIEVKHAYIGGHDIFTEDGREVGSVSSTRSWMPVPPGTYRITVNDTEHVFTLKAGETKQLVRK